MEDQNRVVQGAGIERNLKHIVLCQEDLWHGPKNLNNFRDVLLNGRIQLLHARGKISDPYQLPRVYKLEGPEPDQKLSNSCAVDEDLCEEIKELRGYIEMVKKMVRPGCSPDMLKVALTSIASVVSSLSSISSQKELRSSL